MTSLRSTRAYQIDLTSLKQRAVLSVVLASSYIANGRIVSSDQLEVWILDNSDMAERLRSQPVVDFEVSVSERMNLCGRAFVTLGVSRIGQNKKRYVEAILTVEHVVQSEQDAAPLHWRT